MLRTEFHFNLHGRPQRALAFLLGEAFLGFLAIIAVALTLFPMLFEVGAAAEHVIEAAQWAIIAWFGVEYLVAFAMAESKRLFLSDPWRWIDVATIVIPLASLLPSVSNLLRSSPILRLVRLARLLTLGVRATGVVVRDQHRRAASATSQGPVFITRRATPADVPAVAATRDELLAWLKHGAAGWFHVANPTEEDLQRIGAAAQLPPGFLPTHLFAATHPHLAPAPGCIAVFAWLPQQGTTEPTADRTGVLVLVWPDRVLSFSRARLDVSGVNAFPTLENHPGNDPLPFRVLGTLLDQITHQNETLVAGFEQQLRALEELPLRESRPAFFEQTFRLKKQLSAAQWDLWRLKALLGQLAQRQTPGIVIPETSSVTFSRLTASVDYLYETVVNTREDLLAVIDLHLNVVSFDMNRVMRVLAVVSVLGLIPAVIGGLLGMNLVDNPWHFTLPQVTFVIGFGMLVGLYFFFVKGWLR